MANVSVTEDQVQNMDFNALCDVLDDIGVDYSSLENIDDLRDLVIQSVTNQNSSDNPRQTQDQDLNGIMGRILERDAEMRSVISDIYDAILSMLSMENFEKNLSSELKKEYDDYIKSVENLKEQIQRRHCPIVVAGETGAGKSSLLNLIMGEHVLPRQVLSSTSTICQIFNSEEKRAVVIDENDQEIHFPDVTEATLSEFVSMDRSGKNTKRYKRVDIYWPLPMLKEYATVVDTPGVGESEEMTNILMNYLPEAVAFIYVINTANAGGVQDDRLVKIFAKQLELQKKGDMWEFDPESAIFVCNKWDQVPAEEEDEVWEYIVKRLKSSWPTSKNKTITSQMYKMSVLEELQRKQTRLGFTGKFQSLLLGIDRLISASLERRVKRHIEWQTTFLDRVLMKIIAKTNASKKKQEEKIKLKAEVEKSLKILENETGKIKKTMAEEAEQDCQYISEQLSNHLNKDTTKAQIVQWLADKLDESGNYIIKIQTFHPHLKYKIGTEIEQWCQKHHIEERFSQRYDRFMEKCRLVDDIYRDISQVLQGFKHPTAERNLPEERDCHTNVFSLHNIFVIYAVIALSPIYLLRVVFTGIHESRNHQRKLIMECILKFAEDIIDNFSREKLYEYLQKTYLQRFMTIIEHVCDNIIPKKIESDLELIKNIVKETRDSETLKHEYMPIERECKQIIGILLYAKLTYLSNKTSIKRVKGEIGRGSYSTVILCDVQICDRDMQCAVKKMASPLSREMYEQLTEVANMKTMQHQNIVQCYGISVEKTINEKEHLNIFMEMCDCSLEDIMICDRHPMEMCHCCQQRRQTCHVFPEKYRNQQGYVEAWGFFMQMLEGIVNGLVYLHEKGFVHRDIKLSNILVKDNVAKIADIGSTKFENLLQGTVIGTPFFMAPEVFQGQKYDRSADIFSLAIMMWEMWYGRRVFSESIYADVMTSCQSVKEHVLAGARPKFTESTPPPKEIQTLLEKCWAEVADDRPTARQLTTRLRDIAVVLHDNC
uniref:Uncharacterized protein LOC111110782 n=1 Tax=Crassostrea virginica TaxID=6565 RepID=A0A8B8BIB0_CRAVI|nr:uncharacterized protein LOC111110782 [Crassostrea virginica]XP_022303101.1 uncharacterized protein LOC111110782 [Crassostrea virginica]XP_022303102.1 uncharacterized protein LOC111110782 [Crassostrea virginica]